MWKIKITNSRKQPSSVLSSAPFVGWVNRLCLHRLQFTTNPFPYGVNPNADNWKFSYQIQFNVILFVCFSKWDEQHDEQRSNLNEKKCKMNYINCLQDANNATSLQTHHHLFGIWTVSLASFYWIWYNGNDANEPMDDLEEFMLNGKRTKCALIRKWK